MVGLPFYVQEAGKSDPAVGQAPGVGLDADAPGFR